LGSGLNKKVGLNATGRLGRKRHIRKGRCADCRTRKKADKGRNNGRDKGRDKGRNKSRESGIGQERLAKNHQKGKAEVKQEKWHRK
jgi:hypothetical protein